MITPDEVSTIDQLKKNCSLNHESITLFSPDIANEFCCPMGFTVQGFLCIRCSSLRYYPRVSRCIFLTLTTIKELLHAHHK